MAPCQKMTVLFILSMLMESTDVVIDVDVQTTTSRKCSEVKRKCSVDDIGEKPRNMKKPKLQVARNIEEERRC